jgi:hypothetical protein
MKPADRRRFVLKLLRADLRAWARSKRECSARFQGWSESQLRFGQVLGGIAIAYLSECITPADYERLQHRQNHIIDAKITRTAPRMARAA